MSVVKLAEYLVAPARRRNRIIHDQAEPKTVVVARHRRARSAISSYLEKARLATAEVELVDFAERLRDGHEETRWKREDREHSREAIEAFRAIIPALKLGDRCTRPPKRGIVIINGVEVSVSPEAIVRERRDDHWSVGAIKLCLLRSQKRALTSEMAGYVGTVLQEYLRRKLIGTSHVVDMRLCQVVDVFRQSLFDGPVHTISRMKDIAAACDEIRIMWYATQTAVDRRSDHPQPPAMN